jgi:hypothetical protein
MGLQRSCSVQLLSWQRELRQQQTASDAAAHAMLQSVVIHMMECCQVLGNCCSACSWRAVQQNRVLAPCAVLHTGK